MINIQNIKTNLVFQCFFVIYKVRTQASFNKLTLFAMGLKIYVNTQNHYENQKPKDFFGFSDSLYRNRKFTEFGSIWRLFWGWFTIKGWCWTPPSNKVNVAKKYNMIICRCGDYEDTADNDRDVTEKEEASLKLQTV